MAKSISMIIAEMIEMYPSVRAVSDATLLSRIKSAQEDIYQFVGKEYVYEINNVTTNNDYYLMPDDFRYDNLIKAVYYTDIGTNLIPRIADTSADLEKMKEPMDQVWRTNDTIWLNRQEAENTTVYVIYRQMPMDISIEPSDWDTTYPVIEDEYVDLLIYKVIKKIASYGDVPDISISNNYEREYQEKFAKAKSDFYKRKARNKKDKQDYKKYW
jgi:hypothetical protein